MLNFSFMYFIKWSKNAILLFICSHLLLYVNLERGVYYEKEGFVVC